MALHDPKPRPARDAYAPQVVNFVPGCDGEELQLRCSLLLMRDRASAHARRCSDAAAPVLSHIERLVTAYAFAGLPIDALRQLRSLVATLARTSIEADLFAWELGEGGGDRG